MKYDTLKAILPLLEEFESIKENIDSVNPIDFASWLLEKNEQKELELKPPINNTETNFESPAIPPQGHTQAQIAQLLSLMYKYLKFYIRKGLDETKISNPDDFGFLATLLIEGKLHKNTLIEKNTMEFSSGMEVIRRLERNKLIKSEIDPKDKRAKLVGLTDDGKFVIYRAMPIIQQIGNIAIATLSEKEQLELLRLLHKLNDFHNPIFFEAKKYSIEDILSEYL